MTRRTTLVLGIVLALILCALPRPAAAGCPEILQFLSGKAVGVNCVHSADLRTNNASTTPADNKEPDGNPFTTFADGTALPGLLSGFGSFTPTTDRGVISNGPTALPNPGPVPGVQVDGWFADDPAGEARFLLRFPDNWNGKLVVAGASGTRSEFNGDFAWSDYVVPKGYAYASQNKGVLNLFLVSLASATQPAGDASSCRTNPAVATPIWVHFYDNDFDGRLKPFTQWTQYMLAAARLAQAALKANFNHFPRYTYAVGTSNGGYQVRRAIEEAPDLFDGGVDWEGTFIDPRENILIDLPPAVKNFPGYIAGGCNANSQEARNILAAGYPPDIVSTCTATPANAAQGTLWGRYSAQFWEVTACQWQKRFDPTYDTYVSGLGNYDYFSRLTASVFDAVAAVETTGKIKKPLVTVAGTMDALLPIKRQARAYEAKVDASRKGNNEHREPQYRLYEVQNGNHIESYVTSFFPNQLEVIQPHAQKAFDLLVDHVEDNAPLPPSQCVPKGGSIAANPTEPGNCANLLAP